MSDTVGKKTKKSSSSKDVRAGNVTKGSSSPTSDKRDHPRDKPQRAESMALAGEGRVSSKEKRKGGTLRGVKDLDLAAAEAASTGSLEDSSNSTSASATSTTTAAQTTSRQNRSDTTHAKESASSNSLATYQSSSSAAASIELILPVRTEAIATKPSAAIETQLAALDQFDPLQQSKSLQIAAESTPIQIKTQYTTTTTTTSTAPTHTTTMSSTTQPASTTGTGTRPPLKSVGAKATAAQPTQTPVQQTATSTTTTTVQTNVPPANTPAFQAPYYVDEVVANKYREFFLLARKLNYSFSDLEIVLVGPTGSGKSALVEAILGEPCNIIGTTRRPIYFHAVNDPSITGQPRYTIKDSTSSSANLTAGGGESSKQTNNAASSSPGVVGGEQSGLVLSSVAQLPVELQKRNKRTNEPLVVTIEYKWGFDLTIIDTPPLKNFADMEIWCRTSVVQHEQTNITTPNNRIIVCVEKAPLNNSDSYEALRNNIEVAHNSGGEDSPPPATGVSGVGSASAVQELSLLSWIKRFDPQFARSLYVLTSLDTSMDSFASHPNALNALFNNKKLHGVPAYFCTLPTDEVRTSCSGNSELYKKRLYQYHLKDIDSLKWFDADSVWRNALKKIGPYLFRKNLLDQKFHKYIVQQIPELNRTFNDTIKLYNRKTHLTTSHHQNWVVDNIRSYATRYATHYLRFIELLSKGSISGNPSVNGQTTWEESSGSWDNSANNQQQTSVDIVAPSVSAITLTSVGKGSSSVSRDSSRANVRRDPISRQISVASVHSNAPTQPLTAAMMELLEYLPSAETKLYGAPQLIRLLEEFRLVATKLEMPPILDTELCIASLDHAWTAAEIARSKVEQQFVPLLQLLLNRAYNVMKRMAIVCDSIIDSTTTAQTMSTHAYTRQVNTTVGSGKQGSGQKTDELLEGVDYEGESSTGAGVATHISQKEFPAFSTFLKQSYYFALSNLQRRCQQKCQDEFYSSHTIYWELTGGIDPLSMAGQDVKVRQEHIKSLTGRLYSEIKSRLIDSFVRNVQTYFLSPPSVLDLMKSVLGDVSTLSEQSIREMFKVDLIRSDLNNKITKLKTKLKSLEADKDLFTKNPLVLV